MTAKQIESLKKVFSISVAAFEFADLIAKTAGGTGLDEKAKEMLRLHKSLLSHIEAGTFNLDIWQAHLLQMELLAVLSTVKKFQPGGFINKNKEIV